MPVVGCKYPGLNAYVFLKPNLAKSFSVFPFTRAHMTAPFSVESVAEPDM